MMSSNGPRIRLSKGNVIIFTVAWAVYWALGGFSFPDKKAGVPDSVYFDSVSEVWLYSTAMYVLGSVSLGLVEHKVGFLVPVSIRVAYIAFGLLLMAGGIIWWNEFKAAL